MTAPFLLLLPLAVVLHAEGAGLYNSEHNMNHTETHNSLYKNKAPLRIFSLNTPHNLRIFNKTVLNGNMLGRVKRNVEDRCALFSGQSVLVHPHPINDTKYYSNIDCVTVVNGQEGNILELKFVDLFDIEFHPLCQYDYLEIRDGTRGYAPLLGGGKLCGQQFPGPINTTGPHAWVKFHSDATIENEGFRIAVTETPSPKSRVVPESCHVKVTGITGVIGKEYIPSKCKTDSANQAIEVLWTIEAPASNLYIALNFTQFKLVEINSCKDNGIQVFGAVVEYDSKFAYICGSVAETVTTDQKDVKISNIMNVRYYASKATKEEQVFTAQYTAYRILNTSNKSDQCITDEEFDCQDGTCISSSLTCDGYAHCRLKTDELPERCKGEIDVFNQDIQVIVIILSLIVSGMTLVFLFKCFRKLYLDQKIIKENIRRSMQNGLDDLLALDGKSERDSQAGLFLETEKDNLTRQNISKHKETSMGSLNLESRMNSDIELWRQELEAMQKDKVKVHNGKTKRTDTSKKEEPLRIDRDSSENKTKKKEFNTEVDKNKRNRMDGGITNKKNDSTKSSSENTDKDDDVTYEVKEFACQTRDSLFLSFNRDSSDNKAEKEEFNIEKDKNKRNRDDTSNKKDGSTKSSSVNADKDNSVTTEEFGCQTRDSLFLTDPPLNSNGKRRKSRALSIFGYSRSSKTEPSPPQTMASEITIELNQTDSQNPLNDQKNNRDSRPVSTDTTKSAPDVIIV